HLENVSRMTGFASDCLSSPIVTLLPIWRSYFVPLSSAKFTPQVTSFFMPVHFVYATPTTVFQSRGAIHCHLVPTTISVFGPAKRAWLPPTTIFRSQPLMVTLRSPRMLTRTFPSTNHDQFRLVVWAMPLTLGSSAARSARRAATAARR